MQSPNKTSRTIDPEQLEKIARTVHEALSAWLVAHGRDPHVAWDVLDDDAHQSTYDSVRYVINHPEASPADQHDQWMAGKLKAGWVFGEPRDNDAKVHPMLRPYAELSHYEQCKDALLNAIVLALSNGGSDA